MKTEYTQNNKAITFPIKFGKYVYKETIGSGSTSVVCKAVKRKSEEEFAVKIVSRKDIMEQGTFLSFEQELRVHQSLDHPNIVKIHDVIYSEDAIFVVMDYCSNGDLFDWMNGSMMSLNEKVKLAFYQILSAVDYLHSRNIAHLDIKPENILIDKDMNLKLTDFGCCETQIRKNQREFYGTLLYTAPEILTWTVKDFRKCDIWSLGVLFYTIMTSDAPWDCSSQRALQKSIISGNFRLPNYVDHDVAFIIASCLTVNPEHRATAGLLLRCRIFDSIRRRDVDNKMCILKATNSMVSALSKNHFPSFRNHPLIVKPTLTRTPIFFKNDLLLAETRRSSI